MKMIGIVLFLLSFGWPTVSFAQTLKASSSVPSSQETSAWESFGVERFQEKRTPPVFSLKDLNNNTVSLNDYKGLPVLLFIWATWCLSCKEDIVLFENFFRNYRGALGFLTMVIDGESERRVNQAVRNYGITLPVLLDRREKVARAFGVRMIPTVFLINRDGLMEGMIVGQRDWSGPSALSAINKVLNIR